MTDLLDGWRMALRLAREGEPTLLIEAILVPVEEIATEEIDAEGRRIWRKRFRPWPDDADLRREILLAIARLEERGKKKRGRKRKVLPRDVDLVRGLPDLLFSSGAVERGLPDLLFSSGAVDENDIKAARQWIAAAFDCHVDTIRDVLEQEKTYAKDREPSKEARRLARVAGK